MFKRFKATQEGNTSFLPDDYILHRAERRTNLFALTLFSIVIFGVVGAFFVTNRQWSSVKAHQDSINVRYTQAAKQIEELKGLESQKEQMLSKAELTAALIEKAPRSLLLADLINRMPDKLSFLSFSLTSKRIDAGPARATSGPVSAKSLAGRAGRASKGEKPGESDAASLPRAPQYTTTLVMLGVAPNHENVSNYLAQLQASELLRNVDLKFSEFTLLDNRELIKFRIEATLNPGADARRIEPLTASRAGAFGAGVGQAVTPEQSAVAGVDAWEEK